MHDNVKHTSVKRILLLSAFAVLLYSAFLFVWINLMFPSAYYTDNSLVRYVAFTLPPMLFMFYFIVFGIFWTLRVDKYNVLAIFAFCLMITVSSVSMFFLAIHLACVG